MKKSIKLLAHLKKIIRRFEYFKKCIKAFHNSLTFLIYFLEYWNLILLFWKRAKSSILFEKFSEYNACVQCVWLFTELPRDKWTTESDTEGHCRNFTQPAKMLEVVIPLPAPFLWKEKATSRLLFEYVLFFPGNLSKP